MLSDHQKSSASSHGMRDSTSNLFEKLHRVKYGLMHVSVDIKGFVTEEMKAFDKLRDHFCKHRRVFISCYNLPGSYRLLPIALSSPEFGLRPPRV